MLETACFAIKTPPDQCGGGSMERRKNSPAKVYNCDQSKFWITDVFVRDAVTELMGLLFVFPRHDRDNCHMPISGGEPVLIHIDKRQADWVAELQLASANAPG